MNDVDAWTAAFLKAWTVPSSAVHSSPLSRAGFVYTFVFGNYIVMLIVYSTKSTGIPNQDRFRKRYTLNND